MGTSLHSSHQALQLLASSTGHLPKPSSISLQTFKEQHPSGVHVFLLAETAEDVRQWATYLGFEVGQSIHDGLTHTSAEGTVHDVPLRIAHVADAPTEVPPRCPTCGLPMWPEDEYGPHICPPGFTAKAAADAGA